MRMRRSSRWPADADRCASSSVDARARRLRLADARAGADLSGLSRSRIWRRISPPPTSRERSWCRPRRPRRRRCFCSTSRDSARLVRGVVGWTDFDAADAEARIEALAARNLLVGLRPMVQDIADDDWLLAPGVGAAADGDGPEQPGVRRAGAAAPFAATAAGDRSPSRSAVRARPLRQAAALDRRDR